MHTALNSVINALPAAAGVPEWVHLLPVRTFSGVDGRGPFEVGDAAELIAASMIPGRKLPIDVNHAIDLVGKDGAASPAVGWIVALESRIDGIWGQVEWTSTGQTYLANHDYGFLSPVFTHPKTPPLRVQKLLRAALTNDPNLMLQSLHHRRYEAWESETENASLQALTADDNKIITALGLNTEQFAAMAANLRRKRSD